MNENDLERLYEEFMKNNSDKSDDWKAGMNDTIELVAHLCSYGFGGSVDDFGDWLEELVFGKFEPGTIKHCADGTAYVKNKIGWQKLPPGEHTVTFSDDRKAFDVVSVVIDKPIMSIKHNLKSTPVLVLAKSFSYKMIPWRVWKPLGLMMPPTLGVMVKMPSTAFDPLDVVSATDTEITINLGYIGYMLGDTVALYFFGDASLPIIEKSVTTYVGDGTSGGNAPQVNDIEEHIRTVHDALD